MSGAPANLGIVCKNWHDNTILFYRSYCVFRPHLWNIYKWNGDHSLKITIGFSDYVKLSQEKITSWLVNMVGMMIMKYL